MRSGKKRCSAVFFDWDGCLADTLGIWMELYKLSLSRRNIRAEEQRIVRVRIERLDADGQAEPRED